MVSCDVAAMLMCTRAAAAANTLCASAPSNAWRESQVQRGQMVELFLHQHVFFSPVSNIVAAPAVVHEPPVIASSRAQLFVCHRLLNAAMFELLRPFVAASQPRMTGSQRSASLKTTRPSASSDGKSRGDAKASTLSTQLPLASIDLDGLHPFEMLT